MQIEMKAVLVDDEEPARVRMRTLLEEAGGVTIVAECSSGDDALDVISELQPDLVFLDIEMPGRSGIEVMSCLVPPRPQVIFCTAYDQYAVKAFEEHAVDYLLKPVSRSRLDRALSRAREGLLGRGAYRNELAEASEAQARLFPKHLPEMQRLDYSGLCRPALGVGGDYYDFLPLGTNGLGIALGDVCGKGMPAALLMAGLQGRLQVTAASYGEDLSGLFVNLNEYLCSTTGGARFVTLFYGAFDDSKGIMRYVNAGHNPPILFRASQGNLAGVETLEAGGMVLGLIRNTAYEVGAVEMGAGDVLVLYTDGVTEATNGKEEEFGLERLKEVVARGRDLDAQRLRDVIEKEVMSFSSGEALGDDFTMIVAKGQ